MAKDLTAYNQSTGGNFKVIDTIGVPHPYCITPRHVAYASDHWSGMLSADCIRESEKHGARCDICKGQLSYDQHEQALLVSCKKDFNKSEELKKELTDYLLSIKALAEQEKYAGFAFTLEKEKTKSENQIPECK